MRKVKQVEVSDRMLKWLLQNENKIEIIDGLPEGARIVGAGYDRSERKFYIDCTHDSFDEVTEGSIIPKKDVEIKKLED
jgi:hypothetical protein